MNELKINEIPSVATFGHKPKKRLPRRDAIKRRTQKAEQAASQKLPDVIVVYTELLSSPNEAIRIKAADALRDMAMGKPGQRKPKEDEDERMLIMGAFPEVPA